MNILYGGNTEEVTMPNLFMYPLVIYISLLLQYTVKKQSFFQFEISDQITVTCVYSLYNLNPIHLRYIIRSKYKKTAYSRYVIIIFGRLDTKKL